MINDKDTLKAHDKSAFAKFLTDGLSPTYEWDFKADELSNDRRRQQIKGDVNERYQNWKTWQQSKEGINVSRATDLLSEIPTSSDVLAHVLKDKYQMSNQEIHQTLNHLSRHREIETHTNSYSGTTTFKRKSDNNK